MSTLYNVSDETKNIIKKFRLTTNRIDKLQFLSLKLNDNYELIVDEDTEDNDDDDDWSDDDDEEEESSSGDISIVRKALPSNQPRFVALAYPYKNKIPLLLIYYKPDTCRNQETRMLYVNCLEYINNINLVMPNKVIELTDKSDLDAKFIENLL
ncbi:hypothetical protein ACO0SA_004056 [Hanseniaspora valbyensis]